LAGGMARSGEIPFCHSFCAFITKRVLDQITMQAAYPNLPVKIVGFLPGIATLLGVSHQAIEDIAIMRAVPNMAIFEPSGPEYHAAMVQLALEWNGPAYLRMKRPETTPTAFKPMPLEIGKGVVRREGTDITIISAGLCVHESLSAAELLSQKGIESRVIDMASIKPIDVDLIIESAIKTKAVITAENHSVIGGLGSAVAEVLMDEGIGIPFKRIGIQDQFCEGGTTSYLMRKFGIDADAITRAATAVIQRKKRK
jgi:transketolase